MSKETRKQRGKTKDEVVFPLAETLNELPSGYTDFISDIKNQITNQIVKSRLSANKHMIILYWHIGKAILQKQDEEGWGSKIIDRMSYDLKEEFPDMKGFSPRNLKYMKKFAESWNDFEIMQRTVALIPWRSNITLLDKLKEPDLRLWYAGKLGK